MAKYNERHEEIPDNTPVEMPLGYERPESLQSMIARMIGQISKAAQESGRFETFEEADDFDDDEVEVKSPYQMTDMEEEQPRYVSPKRPAKSPEKASEKPSEVPSLQVVEKAKEANVSA